MGNIIVKNIPSALAERRQWVAWKLEKRLDKDGNETFTKVPYNPVAGHKASSKNPKHWGTLEEALHAFTTVPGYGGIGFVFSKDDAFAGIDLDNKTDNPELQAIHEKILADFPSYTERSPSGKGYHIIVEGEVPEGLNSGGVEIYSCERYFTVTGDIVKNLPIVKCQESLMQLWGQYKSAPTSPRHKGEIKEIIIENRPVTQADKDVIQRIRKSEKCREKFQSFGAGDNRLLTGSDTSDSAVEWNLVRIITCFTQNAEQIERIWLSQPIGAREKTRTETAYRRRTIMNALKEYHSNPYPEVQFIGLDRNESCEEGPQPLRRQLPPAAPFPIDTLGPLLGSAASAIVDIIQCPPAMAGQSVLEAASLAVQAHADVIVPATGQRRPLSLFGLSIAKSGERKSASDSEALAPVRIFQEELRQAYEHDKSRYNNRIAAWKAERNKINANKKMDYEERVEALEKLGLEPQAPLIPIILSDEPTYSGMCLLYEMGHPTLGVFSDEGGQFIGGHGMKEDNKINTAAAISNLWDGKPISRVRRSEDPSLMPGRRLAMHLMVQPEVASVFLSDGMLKGQGLLSRFLLSYPTSTIGTRFQRPQNPASRMTLNQYNAHVLTILRHPLPLATGTANQLAPRTIALEENAIARWEAFADDVEGKAKEGCEYEQISGFANKAAEHALRIAGAITLFENIEAQSIPLHILENAIKLTYYYISEALRLVDSGMVSPAVQKAELLLNWLHTKWDKEYIGTTVLTQNGPNSIRQKKDVIAAIDILVDHNWLIPAGNSHTVNGVKVKQAWRVVRNPAARPANAANQENSRNGEISRQKEAKA